MKTVLTLLGTITHISFLLAILSVQIKILEKFEFNFPCFIYSYPHMIKC